MKQLCLSLIISLFTSVVFAQMSVPPINAPTAPINAVAGVSGSFRLDILHNIDTSAFPDVGPVSIGSVRFKLPAGVKGDSSGCSDGSMPAPGAKIPDCVIVYSWSAVPEGTYSIVTNLVLNLNVAGSVIPLEIVISTPFVVAAGTDQGNPSQPPTPPATKLPPSNTELPGQCKKGVGNPNIPGNSIVNADNLSLAETIPLVGVPFTLNYSSDRFRSDSNINPKKYGLGGWTPSLVHSFDIKNNVLYEGTNAIRNVPTATKNANGYYLANSTVSEIYVFDSNGLHLQTIDALTGISKWTFGYDQSQRLVSVSDQFKNTTSIQYSKGIVAITSPYGVISNLAMNDAGFLAKVTNPNNESYELSTDSKGLLTSFKKPGGQASKVTYDSDGYMIKDEGAGGSFISLARTFDKSSQTQVVVASNALNQKTIYQTQAIRGGSERSIVESHGGSSKISSKDQDSNGYSDNYGSVYQSKLSGDPRFAFQAPYESQSSLKVANSNINIVKKISKSADLADSKNLFSLKTMSTVVTVQNDSKRVFTSNYDNSMHLITVKSPLNRIVFQRLNESGLIGSVQVGNLVPATMSYDSRGRTVSVNRGERIQNLSYDESGNLKASTDSLGRVTSYRYDKVGRITEAILADGVSVLFTYDANGNVLSITPPSKRAHSFGYNVFELLGSYLPPSLASQVSGATVYSYNLAKQLTQIVRPDNSAVTFSYDALSGLLSKINSASGSYEISYLSKTNLPATILAPGNVKLDYQYVGNVPVAITTSGAIVGSVGYSYNVDGTLASINTASADGKYAGFGLNYDLDGLKVGFGDEKVTRNNTGAVTNSGLGALSQNLSYDNYGQLSSDQHFSGKTNLYSATYLTDKLGRIISTKVTTGTETKTLEIEYDLQGRVSKTIKNGVPAKEYQYDSNGNRTGVAEPGKSTEAIYDDQDRLVRYGDTEYQYNSNGDLLGKINKISGQTQYQYDVFGNLRSVKLPSGKVIEYLIDGLNRRVGKKINGKLVQSFIYQSQYQIAAELDGGGNIIKRFVYGIKPNVPDYAIVNGKKLKIISDQIGTPKLIVDSVSGQIVEKLENDEFGIPESGKFSTVIPFGFAGGLADQDTGLIRFGARDYAPEIGRWTTKDPILFQGGSTGLYRYCNNDPVNRIDITGKKDDADESLMNYFDFTTQFNNMGASAVNTVVNAYTTVTGLFTVTAGTAAVVGPVAVNLCLTHPVRCSEVGAAVGSGVLGGLDNAASPPDASQDYKLWFLEQGIQAGVAELKDKCEGR